MEYKARRRHVPAFGEWNYYSSSSSPEEPQLQYSGAAAAGGSGSGPWWYAAVEPEACSDAWFGYSPPPRSRLPPPKKPRRPVAVPADQQLPSCDGGNGMTEVRQARASVAGAAATVARAAPAKGGRRVVRPVDADLYRVPPPDDTAISRRPRRVRYVLAEHSDCKASVFFLSSSGYSFLTN